MGGAAVAALQETDAVAEFAGDRDGGVGGTVVDDDNLGFDTGLGEGALEAGAEPALGVVAGDGDGDFHWGGKLEMIHEWRVATWSAVASVSATPPSESWAKVVGSEDLFRS